MEEQLKERFTKLANSYTDSPQNRTEILFPFYKEISQLPAKERYALHETANNLFVRTRKNKDGEIIEWRPLFNFFVVNAVANRKSSYCLFTCFSR